MLVLVVGAVFARRAFFSLPRISVMFRLFSSLLKYKGRYTDLATTFQMLKKLSEISPQTLFLDLAPELKFHLQKMLFL